MQAKISEMLGDTMLFKLAAELNALFYLAFPSTAASHEIDTHGDKTGIEHMRDCAQRCLLLELMWKIAADKKSYRIIIDDGLYIDEGSFAVLQDMLSNGLQILTDYEIMPTYVTDFLVKQIGQLSPPVLIVISCRPFSHNEHVLDHGSAPAYNDLVEHALAEVWEVGSMDRAQISRIILDEVDGPVKTVSDKLLDFMEQTTQGNAVFVKDMIGTLNSHSLLPVMGT